MNQRLVPRASGAVAVLILTTLLVWGCHREHGASSNPTPSPSHAEAPPIAIDDAFSERALGFDLDLLEDPTHALTLDDVRSVSRRGSASRSTKAIPNFSYSKSAWWARFGISDRRSCAVAGSCSPFVLTYAYPQSDDVHVQCTTAAGNVVVNAHAGDHVPHDSWAIPYREPSFRVPARATECWVRLTGSGGRQFPLTLRSEEAFASLRLRDATVQSAYFGALSVMLAYNLLVAVATGSTAYTAYALFLFTYGLFQFSFGGFAFALLWPNSFRLADSVVPLSIAAIGVASVVFAAILLDLRRSSPGYWRAAKLLVVFFGANLLIAPMIPYGTAIRILTASAPFWAFFLLSAGVNRARAGLRVANFYLAAWAVFIAGTVTNMIRALGLVPVNALTTNAQQLGSALEFVLLSFALADRIKTLQVEVTRNARLAADNANLAREASERALEEHTRTNRELKRLDALKDDFLANTSHELRTPLHGMLGLSEAVLANRSLDAVSRERLSLVVASGRRLASLVNDILDFSKLRHQEIAIKARTIDLAEAVKLAVAVVSPLATAKGLKVRSEVGPDVLALADENRIQQILTNLLGNAVKFTEVGEVTVTAELRGHRVYVAVRDTGIGIAEEAQSRIFESFEQADGSTSREYGGTGLGLAVTKKLVELHGGTVSVVSSPGRGSVFGFDVASASDASVTKLDGPAPAAGGSLLLRAATPLHGEASFPEPAIQTGSSLEVGVSGHLLVADDDPVNVEVLRAQLEPEGYRVTTARDGREALATLEAYGTFDGVLLDVMMPKMTGPEAATKMREAHPHGTLPILMLTAKSRPEDAVVGLRAGASDYVGKPFHREELLQRLDAHMQAVRTGRAFRRFVPGNFLELLGVTRFESLEAGIGQKHDLTVLFTDIRDFTKRSEGLGPEGTFRFVNACLARFEPVVRANGGFVDKFIGDAVMAVFPGDPLNAVRAAAGLSEEVRAFNASRPHAPLPLAIGIGIHKGPVILGTVGASERMEVTVIGDAVNVASRLESLTKDIGAPALVSQDALGDRTDGTRRVGAVRVKGRREPVELFELLTCCVTEEEREQKTRNDERFQRGLRAFAQADFLRAREHFETVVAAAPLDRLATTYLERSLLFGVTGVPAERSPHCKEIVTL